MLFMPIEGAYSLAMQQDTELHSYAWGKRVVVVCPTTLFATLQTVASLWRIEKANKNAEEIAKRAGMLYDRFMTFIEDLAKMEGKITAIQGDYQTAMERLTKKSGNLLWQVDQLKKLGAKTTRSLPSNVTVDDTVVLELVAES